MTTLLHTKNGIPVFNIMAYGAKVDGTTDDTTAVQAAITAAEAAGQGIIYNPLGTCMISTITVSNSKGISFTGTGWGSIYKQITGTNDNMIEFAANADGIWCQFKDLKLDGNGANQSAGNIIDAQHAIECRFENVWFHQPYNWAVYLYGYTDGSFGHHNNFINCLFDNGSDSAGEGGAIKTYHNDENSTLKCEFQYMGGSGSTYNCSILDNSGLNDWSHSTFVDERSGIYILDSSQSRIIGNMFDRIKYDNIYVKGAANTISNNQIYEIGGSRSGTGVASGIVIDYYGQNQITDNFFKASPTNDRTRSFIYDIGGAAEGYNSFVGNKIKDDGGTTSGAAWDINSTPNTRHSNDSDDTHNVVLADNSEVSILSTDAAGGGLTANTVTTDTTLAVNNKYYANAATLLHLTLPATAAVGDVIEVYAQNSGLFSVEPATGDTIRLLGSTTTIGWTADTQGCAIRLECLTANSLWGATAVVGTYTETVATVFYSLQFDGVNDKASIADAADLDGMNTGTWECYFKSSSGSAYQKLFKKDSAIDIGIAQDFGGGAKVFAEVVNAANLGDFGSGVADDTWRHLAISWDGSNVRAFIDGTQVDTSAQAAAQGSGGTAVTVGYAGTEFLTGKISKIRISNNARYTSGFTAPTADFTSDANTIALYLLTEGTGNPVDATGNGHTLTLDGTNPPTWSTDVPY